MRQVINRNSDKLMRDPSGVAVFFHSKVKIENQQVNIIFTDIARVVLIQRTSWCKVEDIGCKVEEIWCSFARTVTFQPCPRHGHNKVHLGLLFRMEELVVGR